MFRDRFFPDPRSRIPNPYFWELSDNFCGEKVPIILCDLAKKIFFTCSKPVQFCDICGYLWLHNISRIILFVGIGLKIKEFFYFFIYLFQNIKCNFADGIASGISLTLYGTTSYFRHFRYCRYPINSTWRVWTGGPTSPWTLWCPRRIPGWTPLSACNPAPNIWVALYHPFRYRVL